VNPRSLRFRMTAWYAGLLAGALLLFGASVYLGLEHYLDSALEGTLSAQWNTIANQLLPQLPGQRPGWLASEINEALPRKSTARKRDLRCARGRNQGHNRRRERQFLPRGMPMLKLPLKDHALHNGVPFKCFHS
jgi:hypothetical protein